MGRGGLQVARGAAISADGTVRAYWSATRKLESDKADNIDDPCKPV